MADRIEIDEIQVTNIKVPIIGTAPLIVHNFSEKSKRQMLDAQQGKKALKVARDPEAEYQAAFYWIAKEGEPNGYGFPVVGVKAAIVSAARFWGKSIKMTELRQFLFMKGIQTKADPQQLVEIHGEPQMREDIVRLGGMSRSADLRYRPEFTEWWAMLDITFVHSSIAQKAVLSLVDAAGLGVGIGEWRPEKKGQNGTWMIDQSKDIEIVR